MIRSMTLADAVLVCERMRALDAECLDAFVGSDDAEAFAVDRWRTNGPAWALCDARGMPCAIFGLTLHTSWMCVCWLIATDAMAPHLWRELIRHARTVHANVTDPTREQYRHRVEAHVLGTWDAARRFAGRLGFTHEGTRRAAGRGGQDIETWAIVGPVKG